MLRINRIRVELITDNGLYGFDHPLTDGLNFIESEENTCGKSSILSAIYYCLGFEEIIGGKGEKVLTSVFKSSVEDGIEKYLVLQSGAFLEISNGVETITVYRAVKMENRDSRLITVYFSSYEEIGTENVVVEDMYVHMPNSAKNGKGFHYFLENFLHLELPFVPTTNDGNQKLYLQLVFSAMFIEQKHGWSDLFSGMPVFGIRESKKRVIEYILALETLDNEKKRNELRECEKEIRKEWEISYHEIEKTLASENLIMVNFSAVPKVLTQDDINRIMIIKDKKSLNEYILSLEGELNNLSECKTKVIDNFYELNAELDETELSVAQIEQQITDCYNIIMNEKQSIKKLRSNIEIIDEDIRNNTDAARIRKLGSNHGFLSSSDICPVCSQPIQDTLLLSYFEERVMSIDENIRHLKAQKEMLQFSLKGREETKNKTQNLKDLLQAKLVSLRRLAQSIRSDLFSSNEDISETLVYKKVSIKNQLDKLKLMENELEKTKEILAALSKRWSEYLKEKRDLPKKSFTDIDLIKLSQLEKNFITNLKNYGYKSIVNLKEISISEVTYMPVIEGFDMKFDSSASDNIRAIWAFTMALLQTSQLNNGNHPGLLIFDEPDQHSIVINDLTKFFKSILKMRKKQVIIAITAKDFETRKAILDIPELERNIINITNKAFARLIK